MSVTSNIIDIPLKTILAGEPEHGGDNADIRAVMVKRVRFVSGNTESAPIYIGGLALTGIRWPAVAGRTVTLHGGPLKTILSAVPGLAVESMAVDGFKGFGDFAEAHWIKIVLDADIGATTKDIYLTFT